MLSDLYSEKLLEAASAIPPESRLERPQASAARTSRVCGSSVEIDLTAEEGAVTAMALRARACALGQASASIVARKIAGADFGELRRLRNEMRAMLKDGGPPPSGERWRDLALLQPIRYYPQRHASVMLVFEAVMDCLDQIEANGGDSTL